MALAFWPIISPYVNAASLLILDTPVPYTTTSSQDVFLGAPDQNKQSIAASEISYPNYGDVFGEITIAGTEVDAPLYFGDSNNQLKNGAGVYNGSAIPGFGKTVLVAGHNHTFFKALQNAQLGAVVTIETTYGIYRYEITDMQVKSSNDKTAYDLSAQEESLILYTCYPFNRLGLTDKRYFIYAKFVSGPVISKYE